LYTESNEAIFICSGAEAVVERTSVLMSESIKQNVDKDTRGGPIKERTAREGRLQSLFLRVENACNIVGIRVSVLFLVLCLIKLVMLIGFRKHLFEIHWRISGQPVGIVNTVAFCGFVALVGISLWRLGKRCAAINVQTVRSANACVLGVGALFILLSFHEGDKNWLYPVMNGILNWRDLGSYLSLNLFFRPPFLAVWLTAYVFSYYILVRSNREHLLLQITAVCAAAYVLLCLRDLIAFGDALVVVNCVGWACVVCSINTRKPLGLGGAVMPFIWGASFFLLFAGQTDMLTFSGLNPEFSILLWGSLIVFSGITVMALKRGFNDSWSWVLPFGLVAFLLFINVHYDSAYSYNNLLCLGFSLPHYFLDELMVAVFVLLIAITYFCFRPGGSVRWVDGVNLAIIAWALLDLRFTQITGARFDWQALSLGLGETPLMMWRMARPYLPVAGTLVVSIAGMYFVVLQVAQRAGATGKPLKARLFKPGLSFVLILVVLLGVAGRCLVEHDKVEAQATLLFARTSPWGRGSASPLMNAQKFTETTRELGISQFLEPQRNGAPAEIPKNWNVVLVFQESTYNQYLSLFSGKEETQPLLSKYKERMEVFPNFFSSFAGSINARFATFAGLYPVSDYKAFTLQRIDVESLFEILGRYGYQNSVFYSSSFDYTGFRDFLRGRNVHEMYDADSLPGERKTSRVSWGVREEETLGAMQEKIKRHVAAKEKFFMTYIPAAPHYPFDGVPARFCKYQLQKVGDFTPRYLNELLYMDWIIASLVDQLEESGVLEKTLVVITSDHGEMLGQNDGPIGHGWAVTPELANVPLIIMDPGRQNYRINNTIGSQVDLLPTVLDLLNIPPPSGQLYQGVSLYNNHPGLDRTIYLSSFKQYALIKGSNIVCGERGRSSNEAFDIENIGSRTFFRKVTNTDGWASAISKFDKYQESFLTHYSHYRERAAVTRDDR
jgi:phosphoglycerol transferase MdoB-like AlkP superfamily enzyme